MILGPHQFMRRLSYVLVLLFPLLGGSLLAQLSTPFSTVDIDGRIHNQSGAVANVPGVLIVLQSRTGTEVSRVMTDAQGRFSFRGLSPGIYQVTVKQKDYLERPRTVDMTFTPHSQVDIDLIPVKTTVTEQAPGGAVSVQSMSLKPDAQKAYSKGIELLLKSDKPADAINEFKKVEKLEPKYADAYGFHAMALVTLNKLDEAASIARLGIAQDPEHFPSRFWLGTALNGKQQFPAAEKELAAALKLAPGSAEANYEMSRALFGEGRWDEAEAAAQKCREIQPDFAAVYVMLGNISLRKRQGPEALKYFEKYLELAPQGPFAPATKELVGKLKTALAKPQ